MIRKMEAKDKEDVLFLMRIFYASPAVLTSGSMEIFERDIENCIGDNPFVEGYVMEENGILQGYAMISKSYSTEFGKNCIWIEDLYLLKVYRNQGIGSSFLKFITELYPDCIYRLEVEEDNKQAIHTYEKCGFQVLPYMEMKKE